MEITKMKEDKALMRPPPVLAPLIKEEIKAGEAAGLEHYQAAGEMLLEAQAQMSRLEWGRWYEKQGFEWSKRTAQRYMQLAEKLTSTPPAARQGLPSMSRVLGDHRSSHEPAYHQPIRRLMAAVPNKALAEDTRSKAAETKLIRELGHQLIKIGYRILAEKLHPDKSGGSSEAMARLNKVKSILLDALP